jgi:hypothetical protein
MPNRIEPLLILLLASSLSFAQHNCPEGFRYAGILQLNGSYGPSDERQELTLPQGATLDTSYQQTTVRSRNGNPSAKSTLTAADIPKGLHISAAGSTDFEKGWAISDPKLKKTKSGYVFGMKLACTTGTDSYGNMGGCSVGVEVCYKPEREAHPAAPIFENPRAGWK